MTSPTATARTTCFERVAVAARIIIVWAALISAVAGGARAARAGALIAVAGPSEGRATAVTTGIAAAVETEIGRLNAAGGVTGETATFKRFDDGCSAERAARTAAEIIEAGAVLVVGHPCTRAALAAAEVYGKAGVLFIATETRHSALTNARAGATIFRLSGRDDAQGKAAGALLARDHGGARIAIIQDRTRYARTIALDAASEIEKRTGGKPVVANIVGGDKEYKATVAKTKSADAILFAGFPIEAGLVRAALLDAGSKAAFLGTEALATDEFAATFGATARDVRVLGAPGSDIQTEAFPALSSAQRAGAAVAVFAQAAQQAGSAKDGAKIAEALTRASFESAIGQVDFADNGDADIAAFAVIEWTGAAWRTVDQTPGVAATAKHDGR